MTSQTVPNRRLIAIEGLPGSGSSELAQWIGDQPGWFAACAEQPITISASGRASLLSPILQILLDRFEWMQGLVGTDLFREQIVTDYLFETHLLWARSLLSEKDWGLYQKIAGVIVPPPVSPDLVVYLQAPDEELMDTLRHLDKNIDADRWHDLITGFNHHFFAYETTPLLVVRTSSASWLGSESAKTALLQRMMTLRGAKTYLMGEADVWSGGQPTAD
jgi:deoxyadenosine/deoxycytidine kinase